MKGSLFKRLFITLSLLIFIIFTLNYYFTLRTFRQHHILLEKENLLKDIKSMESEIQRFYINPAALQKYVNQTSENLSIRLTIIDANGWVLADSQKKSSEMDNHILRPEIIDAKSSAFGFSVRFSDTVKKEMVYVAVKENGLFPGYIRASVFLKSVDSFLDIFKQNIILVAIILLLLSLAGTFFLTRSIAKPIAKLAQATNQIAGGNFDVVIPEFDSEELSELAGNFRIMTQEIKKLFQNISHQKEELTSIIEAMNEQLLIIDAEGKILSTNRSFDEMVKARDLKGHHYSKVIQNTQILSIIKKTLKKQTGLMEEIAIQERAYLCSSAYLPHIRESVFVLRDISELKNLETIKRDLIANVSHELRTPLTAIKGFIETLKDEFEGPNKKYLDIIERHTDRLIFIVQDLLILSRLEDSTIEPDYQVFLLNQVVADTILLLDKKARQKGLKLKVIEGSDIQIDADRNQLVQLFVNIIDNAVKYTEKGEISVEVQKDENFALIDIKDTGIGMEKKHLSRIFERFYVVDSSRSRIQGGTGLGLSIVKHVINNHKGTVEIQSTPGEGTHVHIKLPLLQIDA